MNITRNEKPAASSRVVDTTVVMAVAAILVANSHLESFYPRAWMAGDGLLGNSLFFLLAGYGLVRSERFSRRKFLPWLWRRVVRIHPTLWIVMALFALGIQGEWRNWPPKQYLEGLVWPTRFTFIQLVFPFYLGFFWIMKLRRAWVYPALICALLIPYFIVYIPDAMALPPNAPLHLGQRPLLVHATAYFQVMLLGGWLGWRDEGFRLNTGLALSGLIGTLALYGSVKLEMVLGHGSRGYFLLHLLTFVLCFQLFAVLGSETVVRWVHAIPAAWSVIAAIGGLTLEIYLVHSFIAEYGWVERILFPANVIVFWLLTIPVSMVVGRVSRAVQAELRAERRTGVRIAASPAAATVVPEIPTS